jgi:copper chaperone
MDNVKLVVKGMSCGHCVNSIEGNVGKLNGVQFVKVHLKEVTKVIEDQGYDVALSKSSKDQSCH